MELLTPKEAAKFLLTTEKVLATYRCTKLVNIPYVKIGRRIVYKKIDLENFINRNIVKPKEDTRIEQNKKIQSRRLRKQVLSRDNNRCVFCGSRDNLTLDHIIPVFYGGDAVLSNLQTLCKSCNSKKGAKICSNIEEATNS